MAPSAAQIVAQARRLLVRVYLNTSMVARMQEAIRHATVSGSASSGGNSAALVRAEENKAAAESLEPASAAEQERAQKAHRAYVFLKRDKIESTLVHVIQTKESRGCPFRCHEILRLLSSPFFFCTFLSRSAFA